MEEKIVVQSLDELVRISKEVVVALKNKGMLESLKKLLTELYPDRAHFIYELLQNAEDAGAKTVRFNLTEDRLVFEHDGDKLFSLGDVESITSIGTSTKRDDKTAIGKFGVGFKAVFAYTNSPEIHSGKFHFRIHDLVVPTKDGVPQKSLGAGLTRFLFRFDRPGKAPDDAVDEIEEGLQNLEDTTLLFLNNIHRIEYTLSDGERSWLERIEHDNGHIEVRSQDADGDEVSSHWLRFQNDVQVQDEDGKNKDCRIAVAYSLQQQEGKKGETKWEIVPLERGRVCIYFPAEKETSNLRFHLHAPFASTVARDSVRDCAANKRLRDELATLVVESLDSIRDWNLLKVGFLATLPNPQDNLPEFYEPIRKAIVEAFQSQNLTPTKSGKHAPATELYRGPAKIAEVITNKELALLSGYAPARWVANPPQQHQREDRFLESLEIDEWGWDELLEIFDNLEAEEREKIEKWITEKSDSELMRLYALLGEAYREQRYIGIDDDIRIVRINSEHGDDHVLPKDAFFSSDGENILSDDILFVKPEVYKKGRSESQKENARAFLEHIGVQVYGERTEIIKILNSYQDKQKNITKKHISDIKKFIKYWKKTGDIDIFSEYEFLLGKDNEGESYWCNPNELCIDDPYLHTGLGIKEILSIHEMIMLNREYENHFKEEYLKNFIEFVKNLGIIIRLNIVKTYCYANPNREYLFYYRSLGYGWSYQYGIDDDYTIYNIESYFNLSSFDASLLIWNTLIHADEKVATARYLPNSRCSKREAESQLVYHLRTNAWIPDNEGTFRKPEEMTREELPDAFVYDDRNGLLTAIGFGKLARERDADYQRKNSNAQELGLGSAEKARLASELIQEIEDSGQSFESFVREHKSKRKPAFPESPVHDPERREKRFGEQFEEAPEKISEKQERTIRVSKGAIDPATWLRGKYINDDGQMVCQICKLEMPFKKRDGNPYFESREIFAGKKGKKFLTKESEAQYLALCPVCAAKYREFVQGDEQAMTTLKAAFLAVDGLEVPVTLGEERATIRFVETHLLAFKTILKKGQ